MTGRWSELPARIDALVAKLNEVNARLDKVQREVAAGKRFVRAVNSTFVGGGSRSFRGAGS